MIARGDGSVLYNFAVAVDDMDAAITHVIRGEDHLSNTPKQLLVYEALGATPPVFAHLPLLHGPDGKKLSKRHGAASVQELRDAGYLPEAVRNYLALLGWGSEDDETLIATPDLIARFDLERVSRNPARFDEQKLRWMNGRYLRELSTEELTARLEAFTGRDGLRADRRDLAREDADAGRFLAARGLLPRRAGRRRRRAREVARRGRPRRRSPRPARRSPRWASSTSRASSQRSETWWNAVMQNPVTSSSRCAWRSPERPCRLGFSRVSWSSGGTSRCAAWTRR